MKRFVISAVAIVGAIAALLVVRHILGDRVPGAPRRDGSARNLVLITIDTLRADHVGAYGYRAGTTPALDRIAREGIRFDRAYAPAPITLVSHASMLTGR